MKKALIVAALGALGLVGAFAPSSAEATCTVDSDCKETFGCQSCTVAYALGITGTAWQNRSATDINGASTRYRARRTTSGNGGGLVVEALEVGSSFHTVSGSIGCTGNATSELIQLHEVDARTVSCPPGTTPRRADASINFPDDLCPFEQICAFN
ncbi:MAG: hypothetical protein MUF34_25015 [Polyangiaceae bacterium]|jgi:hypothetical protein|nr:hypothetical protein [Polyangiaceae bacterium]